MKKIVVLTGAGISAESGISTFRDGNGMWENHRVEDVASPDGWARNPKLVLDFYNQRRAQLFDVKPNAAHHALAELADKYEVHIITQNVDDLHERAGSQNVVHLHGELRKVRSTLGGSSQQWEHDLNIGDKCPRGAQLRPDIVWFGEAVPMLYEAQRIAAAADEFWIVGTSLLVYPAAGLMEFAPLGAPIYYIDPKPAKVSTVFHVIEKTATVGVRELVDLRLGIR
jgi:NAD-dependent deacetylase